MLGICFSSRSSGNVPGGDGRAYDGISSSSSLPVREVGSRLLVCLPYPAGVVHGGLDELAHSRPGPLGALCALGVHGGLVQEIPLSAGFLHRALARTVSGRSLGAGTNGLASVIAPGAHSMSKPPARVQHSVRTGVRPRASVWSVVDRPRDVDHGPPCAEEPHELVPDGRNPHLSKDRKAPSQLPSGQTHIVQAVCRCST